MKRKVFVLFLSFLSLFGLTACGNDSQEDEQISIAYSIPGLTGPIWNAAREGFLEQTEALGWEGTVIDPNDSLEQQISLLDNQLNNNLDGLIITPIDGQAVGPTLDKFAEQDVPVVAIDRQVVGDVITTVEADNFQVGLDMGQAYIDSLDGEDGEVLIVGGPLSSSATVLRTDGFKEALEGHDNITIVGESATEFENELALSAVSNYLQSNPNINGIFICTDTLLPAVITALDEASKLHKLGEEDHVFVYSVDGDSFGLEQVVNGNIDATYGLDPYTWASEAVKALEAYMNGETVEENTLVSGHIVTSENYEELKEQGLLWGAE